MDLAGRKPISWMHSKVSSSSNSNPRLKSFVRNRGRRLREGKQSLVDELLPKLLISLPPQGGGQEGGIITPSSNYAPSLTLPLQGRELWLEIGFGSGEHLALQAKLHPEIGMIGCEPYINGLSKLLQVIFVDKLDNIRLHQGDARDIIDLLPDKSIARVFILFPDPWPKSRHHKRRLINHELLKQLARIMKPGGKLLIATDHEDYLTWILERVLTQTDFVWTAKTKRDWEQPPADWVTTKYQAKALREGRIPHWIKLKLSPLLNSLPQGER